MPDKEILPVVQGDELGHGYRVTAEILEYFDTYRLATWAPIAAIIMRERADAIRSLAYPPSVEDDNEG